MKNVFKIIEREKQKGGDKKGICIGIDLRIADREISCPVSKVCHSYNDVTAEAETIQGNLERILKKAKVIFERASRGEVSECTPEMSAEEIWSILSGIEEEMLFVESFNSLDDGKRGEVANHILTKCSVFSGRAAVFSARYDTGSGYIE